MRAALLFLPLAALAAPAAAQPARSPEQMPIPRELTDPRFADRLTDAMMVLSKAFLELPVGEVEAALEGRPPTPADRGRTIRGETGLSEAELRQQIEASRPMMRASMKALAAALPAMLEGLAEAQRELDRAAANLPRPDYPKR